MTTRGMNCLNPINLKLFPSLEPWDGEVRPTTDPKGILCTFSSLSYGLRAGALNFQAYQDKDGCGTLRLLIARQAPPRFVDPQDANNTTNYISFVQACLGCGIDDPINLHDKTILAPFLQAVAHFEQGFQCIAPYQIGLAFTLMPDSAFTDPA